MAIFITGASGFIGTRLVERLSANHHVVCFSRTMQANDAVFLQGSFDRFEDLRKLDKYEIDTVVHLAAVTGGCSEEDGLAVNVAGTRRLFRYLLDRGCTKFITASSIAAVGCLNSGFIPLHLPISDDHPCLAKDAYGFSKAMTEELTRYFHRFHPDTDFTNFRFGAVVPEDWMPPPIGPDSNLSVPFVLLSRVYVSDAVDALVRAAEAPMKKGVRTCNLVGPDSSCGVPTLDMLHAVLGDQADRYDLSYYTIPGNENKPVFCMDYVRDELGFKPAVSTRKPAPRS